LIFNFMCFFEEVSKKLINENNKLKTVIENKLEKFKNEKLLEKIIYWRGYNYYKFKLELS
jgi:hypothetical protein